MRDLQQALEEISAIRGQLARGTRFRGYGPRSIASTGALALAVALGQSWWFRGRPIDPEAFLWAWIITAIVSATLSGWEAMVRSRRMHDGLAARMMQTAVEQFVPAVVAGLLLTVVVIQAAPHEEWMLPGLWEMTFGLGIFASRQFLPTPMFAAGLWYLVSGLSCLALQADSHALAAWTMGIPFGIGQLIVAVVLQWGDHDGSW